jgi:hypothetical protein
MESSTPFWIAFIILQFLSAGHINYQQEAGYYEINPIYGEHPSKERVYATKAAETLAIYGLTELLPKYEKYILIGASAIAVGFMANDTRNGIKLEFKF